MIPTLLLLGLVVGRWWLVPAGAVGWVAVLLATGTIGASDMAGAAAFAIVNTGVGVLAHQVVVWPCRQLRTRRTGHP